MEGVVEHIFLQHVKQAGENVTGSLFVSSNDTDNAHNTVQ